MLSERKKLFTHADRLVCAKKLGCLSDSKTRRVFSTTACPALKDAFKTVVLWMCLFIAVEQCSTADWDPNLSVLQKCRLCCPWKWSFYSSLCFPGRVCSLEDCGSQDVSVLKQTVVPWMCLFYSWLCCPWTFLFNSSLHLQSREESDIIIIPDLFQSYVTLYVFRKVALTKGNITQDDQKLLPCCSCCVPMAS